MIIALDFDETYTLDPITWDQVIALFKAMGHVVYVVTFRIDNSAEAPEVRKALEGKVNDIFFTGRKFKREFMEKKEIYIDVWIDDQPELIVG